jgi:hypothetical protein
VAARVNIGVAIDDQGDLFVPVLRDASTHTLDDLAREFARLRAAVRARQVVPDDMRGGTFTISNLGMYGVDAFTAIINPPESAILAIGRTADTPVGRDGQVVLRPMATFTLSSDHRIVDGVTAARSVADLSEAIEVRRACRDFRGPGIGTPGSGTVVAERTAEGIRTAAASSGVDSFGGAMNYLSRGVLLAAALVLMLAPFSAQGQAPKGKLVLYTSQPERDATQTTAAFRQAYPGVEVEVFRSGTTEVMGKLAAEFAAGAPKADVLLIADAASMEALKKTADAGIRK